MAKNEKNKNLASVAQDEMNKTHKNLKEHNLHKNAHKEAAHKKEAPKDAACATDTCKKGW